MQIVLQIPTSLKSKMNKIDMPFKKLIFSRENQFSLFYMQLCKILWIKKEGKKKKRVLLQNNVFIGALRNYLIFFFLKLEN